jgi:hypothetical protein
VTNSMRCVDVFFIFWVATDFFANLDRIHAVCLSPVRTSSKTTTHRST